jgi:predicted site-specific integrase-resolvase
LSDIKKAFPETSSSPKKTIAYARVSSHDQKADLERQIARLKLHCKNASYPCEIISDLGSGLNYKKRGLNALIREICAGNIERLVLTQQDRLLRFGSQLLFKFCELHNVAVVILDEEKKLDFESELTRDVIELMTVFTARVYGKRSHRNARLAA